LNEYSTSKVVLEEKGNFHVHFKVSGRPHPLGVNTNIGVPVLGDHTGLQQNHIWTPEELEEKMKDLHRHKPQTIADHVMNKLMYGLYHTFNFITGYDEKNPSVKAIEWRLIVLESVAGVPGFVAAGFRHFRSLRALQRDHGWIATLLEEAENERMHLLLCLHTFKANMLTRWMVVATQMIMTPFLMAVYAIHPKAMHRFVGYLEETACHTYLNVIKNTETPGTKLYAAWNTTPAPEIAIGYYRLPSNAKWIDSLKCMMADESHHRDVNHTFASMESDDPNPFVQQHRENAAFAWRLHLRGESAWATSKKESPTTAVTLEQQPPLNPTAGSS